MVRPLAWAIAVMQPVCTQTWPRRRGVGDREGFFVLVPCILLQAGPELTAVIRGLVFLFLFLSLP